jgi:hypothetical protein
MATYGGREPVRRSQDRLAFQQELTSPGQTTHQLPELATGTFLHVHHSRYKGMLVVIREHGYM